MIKAGRPREPPRPGQRTGGRFWQRCAASGLPPPAPPVSESRRAFRRRPHRVPAAWYFLVVGYFDCGGGEISATKSQMMLFWIARIAGRRVLDVLNLQQIAPSTFIQNLNFIICVWQL